MAVGLVCLPGLLSTPDVWAEVRRALGTPLLAPDMPARSSIADMAETLLADLPPRFVLAGHSMGGYVALEMLRAAPERIAGLVLIAAVAGADSDRQREGREAAVGQARSAGMDRFARGLGKYLVGPAKADDPALIERLATMATAIGEDTFAQHQAAIAGRRDNRDLLPTIACPAAVVAGSADKVAAPDTLRETAAAIPGARYFEAEGAGHLVPMEAPKRVAQAISETWTAALADAAEKDARLHA